MDIHDLMLMSLIFEKQQYLCASHDSTKLENMDQALLVALILDQLPLDPKMLILQTVLTF